MIESTTGALRLVPKFAGAAGAQPDIYRIQHDGGEIDRHVGQSDFLHRRSAALVEEQIDKSRYRRAEGADKATDHAEKRDGRPRVPRGAGQTNQIAGKRENPKTDRKDNQHGMDGMLEDARWRTHWRPSLDR